MHRATYPLRDGDMAALHFGRVSNPLKLVFLHANGFNAGTYARVLEPLGVHAMAVDLRGHGRSTLPADAQAHKSWRVFRDDVVELFERHIPPGPNAPVLAGHSLGAGAGMLAARKLGRRISGYVALDPVTMPRSIGLAATLPGVARGLRRALPIARAAGRRRAAFASREEAFAHYQGRGMFGRVPDAVLRDYLADGLKPDAGGVRLSCDPVWEQANYAAQGHDLFRAAQALPRWSRIAYGGGPGAPHSAKTRAAMARILGPDRVSFAPELGHLFPLERPELATGVLRDALREVALARR